MSAIIGFYRNNEPNTEGRTLDDICLWSDHDLMDTHDVVQWLFPLAEPSQFNPTAPILTDQDILLFRTDPRLRKRLLESYVRFLQVFGLAYRGGEVQQIANRDIWMSMNHNWLRFTRILKSLTLLGLPAEALAFFRFLDRKIGNVKSMAYWREAVGKPPGVIKDDS